MTGIAVTGLGAVGPWGVGLRDLATALERGAPLVSPLPAGAVGHLAGVCPVACTVPDVDLREWLAPRESRRMSRLSRMAVASARMALLDAEWAGAGRRLGVVFATVFGASVFTEEILDTILDPEQGPQLVSPFHFTDCVANAPAGQVAIAVGARGANHTVCQREAGAVLALLRGVADLRADRVDGVVVGAVDEISPLVHGILDRLRVVTRTGTARPFAVDRDGVLAGEGATCVVLERCEDAAARGARERCRVLAGGRAFDPTAPAWGWGRGVEGLAAVLREVVGAAGSGIERIVSGASGSRRGDALEEQVLDGVFGGERPAVVIPKSVVGEYGGGLGAAAVLEAEAGARVLWTALGSGGAAAWAVLGA